MPHALQGRMLGYGALAGAGALALSVGVGFITYAAWDGPPGRADDPDYAAIMGFAMAAASTAVTVPIASGLTVHAVGKRAGYRGGRGASIMGAILGMGIGAGAVLAGLNAFQRDESLRLGPTIACGSVIGLASVAGFSVLGFRFSDFVRTQFLPTASTTSVGLRLGGTF